MRIHPPPSPLSPYTTPQHSENFILGFCETLIFLHLRGWNTEVMMQGVVSDQVYGNNAKYIILTFVKT